MADWITVTGLKPWDGRYQLDLDEQPLTTREWGWIKRHAGYLPLTLTGEAFADPELVAVLAVIAVRRAGTLTVAEVPALVERLADAPFGTTVTLETDDAQVRDADEGDADPPRPSSDVRPSTSGTSSPNGSATSAGPPKPTGAPASDTSVSAPSMSVS
jgi:hypothetical protein